MGILMGDFYPGPNGKGSVQWQFDKGIKYFPEGKWLSCDYGDGNDVMIGRRIDDDTYECTVKYVKNRLGYNDFDIRCKW